MKFNVMIMWRGKGYWCQWQKHKFTFKYGENPTHLKTEGICLSLTDDALLSSMQKKHSQRFWAFMPKHTFRVGQNFSQDKTSKEEMSPNRVWQRWNLVHCSTCNMPLLLLCTESFASSLHLSSLHPFRCDSISLHFQLLLLRACFISSFSVRSPFSVASSSLISWIASISI